MSYRFFLSYASADDDGDLRRRFFADLAREVRSLYGDGAKVKVGFFAEHLENGIEWNQRLIKALNSSATLIVLGSPAYFRSEYCGKEWGFFESRIRTTPDRERPPVVKFVRWVIQDNSNLPANVQNLHLNFGGPERAINQYGLRHMLQEDQFKSDVLVFIKQLASEIKHASESYPLSSVVEIPKLAYMRSFFEMTEEIRSTNGILGKQSARSTTRDPKPITPKRRSDKRENEAASRPRHSVEDLAIEKLNSELVRIYSESLIIELRKAGLLVSEEGTVGFRIVDSLSNLKCEKDTVLESFIAIRLALNVRHSLVQATQIDAINSAAVAAYLVSATRLTVLAAQNAIGAGATSWVRRVASSDDIICAIIATANFGGELEFVQDAGANDLKPKYLFQIEPAYNGEAIGSSFLVALYVSIFKGDQRLGKLQLSEELNQDQIEELREEIATEVLTIRRKDKKSLVFVVRWTEGEVSQNHFRGVAEMADRINAPILIRDSAAVQELIGMSPVRLKTELKQFWRELLPGPPSSKPAQPQT